MSLLNTIYNWRQKRMQATGQEPEFVPLTREELGIIISDADFLSAPIPTNRENQIFGMSEFSTPFAAEIRERTIDLEQVPAISECSIDEALSPTLHSFRNDALRKLRMRLEAHVCKDDTKITVTLPFDPWEKLKTFLHITRWFPIKKKTVQIDARVLYPYLKISLPANRHHVRFAVRP